MRSSAVRSFSTARGLFTPVLVVLTAAAAAGPAWGAIVIKDRHSSEPLVLDQPDDYLLHNVRVTGVTDLAALTLTGRINSVTIDQCVFSNVWSGVDGKASAADAQGAVVGSLVATNTRFEDAQHQLVCLREGAFGTVSFQRCTFRTSESFLKRIYADDPWRTAPPTTEFANIDRLELIDNEYANTVLVVHPSVKVVVFRGDLSNVKFQSPGTTVIRLRPGQDPADVGADVGADGTAVVADDEAEGAEPPPVQPPPPAAENRIVVADASGEETSLLAGPASDEPPSSMIDDGVATTAAATTAAAVEP